MEIWLHERMCAFAHARTHTHAHNYCISLDTCMQISLKGGCIYSAAAAKAPRMKGNKNYCLRLTFFLVLGLFSYRHDFKIIIWFCFEKRLPYINASNLGGIASEWEDGSFKPKLHGRLQISLILKLMFETCQKSWNKRVYHCVVNNTLEQFGKRGH